MTSPLAVTQSLFDLLEPIVVETGGEMLDGKPFAVRLRPLSPLEWSAFGRGFPAGGQAKAEEGDQDETYAYIRKVVCSAISHFRAVTRTASAESVDGQTPSEFEVSWVPVQVVFDREPDRSVGEFSEKEFDRRKLVAKCWKALLADLDEGDELAAVKDARFLDG